MGVDRIDTHHRTGWPSVVAEATDGKEVKRSEGVLPTRLGRILPLTIGVAHRNGKRLKAEHAYLVTAISRHIALRAARRGLHGVASVNVANVTGAFDSKG